MFLLALSAAALSQPAPGPIKTFTDWVVACDNVRRCEMTVLEPEEGAVDMGGARLFLVREPGPTGQLTITVSPAADKTDTLALTIDGKDVASGRLQKGVARFTGAQAVRIAAALADGHSARVVSAAAGGSGTLSLAGASAVLRFIDAQQGRAGGVTALVARGGKPASAVPAPAKLPVVRRIAAGGRAAPLSPKMLAQLNRTSGCAIEYSGDFVQPAPEIAALGDGSTLVLLPCGAGAYNMVSTAYILRAGKLAPARFDHGEPKDGSPTMLINSGWDADSGTLSTYGKGRGLGDCGEAASYAWDGTRFRVTSIHRMDECRGSIHWLTIWRATASR